MVIFTDIFEHTHFQLATPKVQCSWVFSNMQEADSPYTHKTHAVQKCEVLQTISGWDWKTSASAGTCGCTSRRCSKQGRRPLRLHTWTSVVWGLAVFLVLPTNSYSSLSPWVFPRESFLTHFISGTTSKCDYTQKQSNPFQPKKIKYNINCGFKRAFKDRECY